MERNCKVCGSSEWTELFSTDYPERRSERDRTVKHVFGCKECGAQGKRFEHKNAGTEQFSGALR